MQGLSTHRGANEDHLDCSRVRGVHEILGLGSAFSEKGVFESYGSFIVIAVLGDAEGGAGGGVGYRGYPGGIGYVLHYLICASGWVREHFCCRRVIP